MGGPAAPGWYEADNDPLRRAYWDGSCWTARARYADGSWRPEELVVPVDRSPGRSSPAGWNGDGRWLAPGSMPAASPRDRSTGPALAPELNGTAAAPGRDWVGGVNRWVPNLRPGKRGLGRRRRRRA